MELVGVIKVVGNYPLRGSRLNGVSTRSDYNTSRKFVLIAFFLFILYFYGQVTVLILGYTSTSKRF